MRLADTLGVCHVDLSEEISPPLVAAGVEEGISVGFNAAEARHSLLRASSTFFAHWSVDGFADGADDVDDADDDNDVVLLFVRGEDGEEGKAGKGDDADDPNATRTGVSPVVSTLSEASLRFCHCDTTWGEVVVAAE